MRGRNNGPAAGHDSSGHANDEGGWSAPERGDERWLVARVCLDSVKYGPEDAVCVVVWKTLEQPKQRREGGREVRQRQDDGKGSLESLELCHVVHGRNRLNGGERGGDVGKLQCCLSGA